MRFPGITDMPDLGNSTSSQLGRHSGGAKPLERQYFSVHWQMYFFTFHFGSTDFLIFPS